MSQAAPERVEIAEDDWPTPKLAMLLGHKSDLFEDSQVWGTGPIREEGDLSPYTSGPPDLPPEDRVTHQVETMIMHVAHWDRVVWAIKTTEGRIIAVMQQRHDADQSRVGGEVEIINAPFREIAVKGLEEDIINLQYLLGHVCEVRGV